MKDTGHSSSKYQRVVDYVLRTPWAIRPEVLGAIIDIVIFRAEGGQLSDEELADRIGAAEAARTAPRTYRSVAIIGLYGSIFPRANLFTEISGGTSLQKFASALAEADRDESVSSIILDVASPGGLVDMVPETAERIRRVAKPISAVANTQAASAAYWIASQADELVVTPSGEVGSIGVFAAHEDWSRHDDNLGVKTTLISAGRYKTELSPFEPLSDEARAALQAKINTYYDMFVSDVARGRGVARSTTVRNGFGQGRMVTAAQAVSEGMVDRVATFDQVVSEHARGRTPLPRAGFRSANTESFYKALLDQLSSSKATILDQLAPEAESPIERQFLSALSREIETSL